LGLLYHGMHGLCLGWSAADVGQVPYFIGCLYYMTISFPLYWPKPAQYVAGGFRQTLSLHYYYLAFVVLTYLAHLIAVNTSYRPILGITNPDIQALIALE
jgi:hypothetical protein